MDKKLVVYMRISLVFFFFKQKTAYEMRISDWSSDVCSSDLGDEYGCCHACVQRRSKQSDTAPPRWFSRCSVRLMRHPLLIGRRSEEHTSELQSLMRILYAVFCLKQKH